jgi:chemotaxis protein MotB
LNDQIANLEARLLVTQGDADQRDAEAQQALANAQDAVAKAEQDRAALRMSLAAAVAAKLAAEELAGDQSTDAERREALLATARAQLSEQEEISLKAQRQAALLNQQVGALRTQLGDLQALLDDAKSRDTAKDVQLQSLGSELNTALARVASEERRRRQLEEAERKRLEAETQDLERYRSEFFGRLRDLLGTQEGVRIVGDRFIFSSEVLFDPGRAALSPEGSQQIARIADILRNVASDIPPEINWVLQVDGHTDNIPLSGTGQYRDNWELSQARALSVVKYMISDLQISPDRLSANGFGEFQPVNAEDSPEARAQNRRIEIKFTEK